MRAIHHWQQILLVFLAVTPPIMGGTSESISPSKYMWATPVRLATATCSEFPWVSDLPMTSETLALLKRCAVDEFGLSPDKVDSWNNGSADEFLSWMKELVQKGDTDSMLILYFATHQKSDGRTKFVHGPDLPPAQLMEAINALAKRYQRVLFIDDSCYAAALEKCGSFSENVIRLYSSEEDAVAIDLNFDNGPYGLDEFIKKEQRILQSRLNLNLKGMSFLSLMGLKAAVAISDKSLLSIDLQTLVREMNQWRDQYDEDIRQAKVQHLKLVPADANLEILKAKR